MNTLGQGAGNAKVKATRQLARERPAKIFGKQNYLIYRAVCKTRLSLSLQSSVPEVLFSAVRPNMIGVVSSDHPFVIAVALTGPSRSLYETKRIR